MDAKIYQPKEIEDKWKQKWMEEKIYRAIDGDKREKSYLMIEFPYPSGERLHVGHARSYSCLDSVARKRRMQGKNVMFPFGWDAFGLPAENYAIKHQISPQQSTAENIQHAKKQVIDWGLSFDWDREINTTDPAYYKWTQWIFLQLFKKGLAYKQEIPVNWCPSCKTNLANEEVIDGKCERCGAETERRRQSQWILKITEYADRLLEDLKTVNFREDIAAQQINWIGKKEGINIHYPIEGTDKEIEVFTTRPDTNFGATFVVIAPEHAFVQEILNSKSEIPNKSEIQKYVSEALGKSERERQMEEKKKTGVFTGFYAINHLTGYKMPIWISDFVLAGFGTGAVVGVPGHDKRDFEFAQFAKLPVIRVVVGKDGDASEITKIEQVQEEEGTMVNSGFLDGLDIHEATKKVMDYIEEKGWGKKTATYHLRDWVFSRQHYWGEPIPMIFCENCAKTSPPAPLLASGEGNKNSVINRGWVPVPEEQLPVVLPELEKYQPTGTGESPLAQVTDWVNVTCPKCGGAAKRETDTMPNWAGSSWYFLRYCDPRNEKKLADMDKLKYWLMVDWYNGGMEHTTLHLLYSRFWHKFLYDLGVVPTPEPYAKRTSHGVILGPDNRKMSKSKGNVINPDDVVNKYGADSLRLYEMFIGPFDQMIAWSWESLEGVHRFVKRIWVLVNSYQLPVNSSVVAKKRVAKLIIKVDADLENMKFNTAVAAMMEWVNWWGEHQGEVGKPEIIKFIKLLAPAAPFVAEELYQQVAGNEGKWQSVHQQAWPEAEKFDETEDTAIVVVQVNGKVRGKMEINGTSDVVAEALKIENVQKFVGDKKYKQIYIPKRILNLVTE